MSANLAPPADLQSAIAEKANELLTLLAAVQSPSLAPHAAREEREAARSLYEWIINYRGLLYRRPLLCNIEFLARNGCKPGWYYRCPKASGNWIGPYPSHYACKVDRDYQALQAAVDACMDKYAAMAGV